ncbi:hypothetical protein B0H15DRAFT_806191 [Mycena belliarum]|uniref:Uncharacterized protein n=1 Tax=Mycena belliarum TaxID=1033014 RepID=A0AAD6XHL5_9AGAR|nr:hypothetical protein B0H15DRAFT_806191 [Mycena belliae]
MPGDMTCEEILKPQAVSTIISELDMRKLVTRRRAFVWPSIGQRNICAHKTNKTLGVPGAVRRQDNTENSVNRERLALAERKRRRRYKRKPELKEKNHEKYQQRMASASAARASASAALALVEGPSCPPSTKEASPVMVSVPLEQVNYLGGRKTELLLVDYSSDEE